MCRWVYSTADEDGVMLYCKSPACQQREREEESMKGELVIDPKQQSREGWRSDVDALLGADNGTSRARVGRARMRRRRMRGKVKRHGRR
jgi:hypothetical protein